MVLKNRIHPFLLAGLILALPAAAEKDGEPPTVSFPLAEYLAMVEKAEQREKAAAQNAKSQEAPVAEVVEEKIALRLEDKEARLDSRFEVLVQGEPIKPVWLPLAGFAAAAAIEKQLAGGGWGPAPSASLTAYGGPEKGAILVAAEKGRYRIAAQSRLPLDPSGGQIELALLKVAAPVASAEIDLPAELEWASPGAVLVADVVTSGRRQLRLATQRGSVPLFQARRRFDQGEEKALAHAVALTLWQLRPEGLRRHDVLLYEVSRGRLSAFEVSLPPGLEIEQAATDEGPVVPVQNGDKLRVERRRRLQGTGYLVLSSTPESRDEQPFTLLRPEVEVRARFLAVASSLAAEIGPRPAASFSQIDLSDLPPLLGQALGAVDLAAAWRLADDKAGTEPLSLRLAPLPAATMVATTVTKRDTTTLLTVDGTLLHRETFELAPADRPASSFEVELPAAAILWSTKVDGQPTRPLERGGKIVLPILPRQGQRTTIEVVAVLEQAIAPGRSQLAVELARVASPVLEHSWRLLLPDGPKYRFAGGELHPVPAHEVYYGTALGVAGGELGGIAGGAVSVDELNDLPMPEAPLAADARRADKPSTRQGRDRAEGKKEKAAAAEADEEEGQLAAANYFKQVDQLQQGLVGGVKPLPITIPESGKSLVLSGVLPPERVSVVIDVKAKK
jgi:hypothetical protein